jgi:hypothetical protein
MGSQMTMPTVSDMKLTNVLDACEIQLSQNALRTLRIRRGNQKRKPRLLQA